MGKFNLHSQGCFARTLSVKNQIQWKFRIYTFRWDKKWKNLIV